MTVSSMIGCVHASGGRKGLKTPTLQTETTNRVNSQAKNPGSNSIPVAAEKDRDSLLGNISKKER